MRKIRVIFLLAFVTVGVIVIASGCNVAADSTVEEATTHAPATVTPTHLPPPPTPRPTHTPDPFSAPVLKVVGEEEVVFDWTTDQCVTRHIPDMPVRAFRDASEQIHLIVSHDTGYQMLGADLNSVTVDCNPMLYSAYQADPALFSDAEWIAAPYTEDGVTVYSVLHNEYQGHTHPDQCPQGDYFPCWYNSLTLAVSTDGGQSYTHVAPPPAHLVASLPYRYEGGAGPYGIFSPSNIVKAKDGYYYEFVKVDDYHSPEQWVCLMRTQDLTDPKSWRFWDGVAFKGQFANPYTDEIGNQADHVCPPIDRDNIGASLVESITYNTYTERYVLIGLSADQIGGREVWGFYYSFSDNLINWTRRKLLVEMPLPWTVDNAGGALSYLYPTLLDPDSLSRNFETTDQTAYLYYTRHNFGQGSLDRDLIRIPVEFFPSEQAYRESQP